MQITLPLAQDKKLTVVFRVEPGCLGPDGKDHVDEFCNFAGKEVESIEPDFVLWNIVPRDDKSLPEMQFRIGNKNLTHDQAEKYLKLFDKSLDDFEENWFETLAVLISKFLEQ